MEFRLKIIDSKYQTWRGLQAELLLTNWRLLLTKRHLLLTNCDLLLRFEQLNLNDAKIIAQI
jgi:hypothetical protein